MRCFTPWCLWAFLAMAPLLVRAQNFQIRVQAYAPNVDSVFELSQVPAIEFSQTADSSLIVYLHVGGTRTFVMRSIDSIVFSPDTANTSLTFLFADGSDSTYPVANVDSIVIPPVATSGVVPVQSAEGMLRCYPNPSGGTIRIAFTLPERERLQFALFNAEGARVKEFGSESYSAGSHILTWASADDSRNPLSPGTYVLELSGSRTHESLNVVIVH